MARWRPWHAGQRRTQRRTPAVAAIRGRVLRLHARAHRKQLAIRRDGWLLAARSGGRGRRIGAGDEGGGRGGGGGGGDGVAGSDGVARSHARSHGRVPRGGCCAVSHGTELEHFRLGCGVVDVDVARAGEGPGDASDANAAR